MGAFCRLKNKSRWVFISKVRRYKNNDVILYGVYGINSEELISVLDVYVSNGIIPYDKETYFDDPVFIDSMSLSDFVGESEIAFLLGKNLSHLALFGKLSGRGGRAP